MQSWQKNSLKLANADPITCRIDSLPNRYFVIVNTKWQLRSLGEHHAATYSFEIDRMLQLRKLKTKQPVFRPLQSQKRMEIIICDVRYLNTLNHLHT